MVTLFRLLQHGDILFQIRIFGVGGAVDSGEHLVLLVATPVGAGIFHQFDGFHRLGGHQMGAGTEIREFPLAVETDDGVLRKVLNQLHLVGLVFLLEEPDGIFSWKFKALQRQIFLHNLLHLGFDGREILGGDWGLNIQIIVEAVVDGRADGQLRLRVQTLDGLGHNVGSGVAEGVTPSLVLKGENVQRAVPVNDRPQIHPLAVHLPGACHSRQTLAHVFRDV